MSFITLRNGQQVGDYHRPYIVAELNTSHFGDIAIAKRMIDQAKVAGCDCVKFQSWAADSLYCDSYYQLNKIAKRMVTKFALSDDKLRELSGYAREKGIEFASTPYSIEEAIFLVNECNVPFLKVASMDLNNVSYLTELAQLQIPLVLSTGMGTLEEIIEAVHTIEEAGNRQLIILHCTSVYPADPEIIRLRNVEGLRGEFRDYPIGYSDHSVGIEIPSASVALGACLIEKHFTLDRSRIGMDNQMATEPLEMGAMVKACHRVYDAMGGAGRLLCEKELGQISKMRRSIVSKIRLLPGDILTESNIEFKRPGTGLPPSMYKKIINREVAKKIEAGSVITEDDLL